MATMIFNKSVIPLLKDMILVGKIYLIPQSVEIQLEHQEYMRTLRIANARGAMFDARVFNIPKEEVTNLIYWLN